MENTDLQRIITLIDMDCFYCQVELKLNPNLAGKPVAVVQYNQWKLGGIIAVNYEARDRGVTRFMRGKEAKKVCPELYLASVPSVRGKADLTRYRNAGVEVANVFTQFSDCVERASVDEAFIDLTSSVEKRIHEGNVHLTPEKFPSTFVVGYSDSQTNDMENRADGIAEWTKQLQNNLDARNPDYRLAIGALIVEEIRREVFKKTGFHCSAGIAHNKILAKLVAGVHKPKCQTVIPHDNVPELYDSVAINKVRGLGGKFGKAVTESLNITLMAELCNFSKEELTEKFNAKNGAWLYNIARGIDYDPVISRLIAESIGCSKNFPGPTAICSKEKLRHWLKDMTIEVVERLEKDQAENSRRAKLLTITYKQGGVTSSRSSPLSSYKVDSISRDAYEILMKTNQAPHDSTACNPPIKYLGITASKFASAKSTITNFLKDKNITASKSNLDDEVPFDDFEPDLDLDNQNSTEKRGEQNKNSIKSYFTLLSAPQGSADDGSDGQSHINVNVQEDDRNKHVSTLDNQDSSNNNVQDAHPYQPLDINIASSSGTDIELKSSSAINKMADDVSSQNNELTVEKSNGDSTSFFTRMIVLKEETSTTNIEQIDVQDVAASTSTEDATEDDWLKPCLECNKKIHVAAYVEHMDYHEAVRVHRSLNGKIQVKTALPKPTTSKGSPAKKRRKIADKPIDQREITNFFCVMPK